MVKSTHPHINNHLLAEEPLSLEQNLTRQEHLRDCPECRQQEAAWVNVHHLMLSAPSVEPTAGFSTRFQGRLAAQHLRVQRKRTWIFFGVTIGVALVFSALLIFSTLQFIDSPLQLLSRAIYFSVILFSYYQEVAKFVGNMSFALPFFSITGLVFFTGFVSLISVLWAVVYKKLSSSWRIIS